MSEQLSADTDSVGAAKRTELRGLAEEYVGQGQ